MIIRDIEVETCAVCGKKFDKLRMHRVFTGRVKYICPHCEQLGSNQIDARQTEWRQSSKGKAIIEQCEKYK